MKDYALPIDINIVIKAMKFRLEYKSKKLSFIDCVGYVIAKEKGLKFLTGDKEFESIGNVEFVK